LVLKLFLFPVIWISGIAYLLYGVWGTRTAGSGLQLVAVIHTSVAFAMVVFIIIHVYLLTTGHSFVEHVKPMITGFDEVELSASEEAYLEADEPGKIRK